MHRGLFFDSQLLRHKIMLRIAGQRVKRTLISALRSEKLAVKRPSRPMLPHVGAVAF